MYWKILLTSSFVFPCVLISPISGHASELPFVWFPDDAEKFGFHYLPEEVALSYKLFTLWTNFAHTGNPNTPKPPVVSCHDDSAYIQQLLAIQVRPHVQESNDRFSSVGIKMFTCDDLLPSV